MFREMRRFKNAMTEEKSIELLFHASEGTLSTFSVDHEYPYNSTVNYVYTQGKIYIHSASSGHKIDNINHNPNVCFSVFGNVEIDEEHFTTKYESVVLFGKAKIIESSKGILYAFIEKYSPGFKMQGYSYVDSNQDSPVLIEITIDYFSGKERK